MYGRGGGGGGEHQRKARGPHGHRSRENQPGASLAGERSRTSGGCGRWERAVGCPRNGCGCRGISRVGFWSFAGLGRGGGEGRTARGDSGGFGESAWQQAGGSVGVWAVGQPRGSPGRGWRWAARTHLVHPNHAVGANPRPRPRPGALRTGVSAGRVCPRPPPAAVAPPSLDREQTSRLHGGQTAPERKGKK